jgi:rubrerythrin
LLWMHRRRKQRMSAATQSPCPACGYSLVGNTSGVCPECGKPIDTKVG